MDPDREKLYETCQRLGVGITVMKAFGGGDLLSEQSPAGKALTVSQCLHYALPHTAGSCIRCGVCETRCPFHVPIRENMKQAAEIFGK